METTRLAPPELFDSRPSGFFQLVITADACRTVHLSGLVAWNSSRELIGVAALAHPDFLVEIEPTVVL